MLEREHLLFNCVNLQNMFTNLWFVYLMSVEYIQSMIFIFDIYVKTGFGIK